MDNKIENNEKYIMMTTQPVGHLINKLAVPTIISMLVSTFYNMVDTLYVGRVSTEATAALGVAFSLQAIIQAFGFFFGQGSGNYISRSLGSKDFKKASIMAAVGFYTPLILGTIFGILGIIFLRPLSIFLGATPTILKDTMDYLRYILIGTPFMMASLVLNNQLRLQGNASFAMIGITVGSVLNIVLDPIFIFTFNMGVGGAALATIISQIISFIILIWGTRQGDNLKIHFNNFKPGMYYYKMILQGGTPSLARQSITSFAVICLNFVAGKYGDSAIAAFSVVSRIMLFANSTMIGFGQGFQPVCGFNFGAKLYQRVEDAYKYCIKVSFVVLLVISSLVYYFAPSLIKLFRAEDLELIRIGVEAIRYQCLTFPLVSFIVMTNMLLQNINFSIRATILSLAQQGIFFIPTLFIMDSLFKLVGLELTQAIAYVFSFGLAIYMYMSVKKEFKILKEHVSV